jgi:transcriptional regulator with XRE-family HTH domain
MGTVIELKPTTPTTRPSRLRLLRGASGITQAQLAERVGVDRLTIRRWEADRLPIPNDQAYVLAHLFEVSVPWFVGDLTSSSRR